MDELNEIPAGFNNNIIWNIGHLISAQAGVCYARANSPVPIKDDYFQRYRSGTKPERPVDLQEIQEIKELLITSANQLENDYKAGVLSDYTAWTSRYDVEITSIEDAIKFILFHEGLHQGYVLAQKRLVKAKANA